MTSHVLLAATVFLAQVVSGTVTLPEMPGQPRDPRATPNTGTAVIKGRVTTADTGVPLRRAIVQLMGGSRPRAVHTDDDGRYTFESVAPGAYAVSANPGTHRPGYRAWSYGADPAGSSFMMAPLRLNVADGQVLENIDIAVPRGGAIVGRVTDPSGEPAGRVQVRTLMLRPGQEPMQMSGASTDDLGNFRLFGLVPGDYLVLAEAMNSGQGPDVEGERIGFARTFAPGTNHRDEAARVRVRPGMDAAIDIRLLETTMFQIRGSVVNSQGEPVRNAGVSLMRTDVLPSGGGAGLDQSGQFAIRNVAPGTYDLIVNYSPPGARPDSNGRIDGREMAVTRVDVASADVDGLVLVTAPGASFAGEIVFDDSPPPGVRAHVTLMPAQSRGFAPGGTVTVNENAFIASDVFGPVLIRGTVSSPGARSGPLPPGASLPPGGLGPAWSLKEVLLNGKDITDVPTSFGSGQSGRVQLVFTSRAATVDGTVLDDAGQPVRASMVMVFGVDEQSWTFGSSRVRNTMVREDGKFSLRGLRPGRYYVVAVQANGPIGGGPTGPDREFLRTLKSVATEVLVNENETRSVDLRVVRLE